MCSQFRKAEGWLATALNGGRATDALPFPGAITGCFCHCGGANSLSLGLFRPPVTQGQVQLHNPGQWFDLCEPIPHLYGKNNNRRPHPPQGWGLYEKMPGKAVGVHSNFLQVSPITTEQASIY